MPCDQCGREFADGERMQARTLAVFQRKGRDDDGPFALDEEWLGMQCLNCDDPAQDTLREWAAADRAEEAQAIADRQAMEDLEMSTIHVSRVDAAGHEEGNQWKFGGGDEELCRLFDALCEHTNGHPMVVKGCSHD